MRKRFRVVLAILLVAVVGGVAWQGLRPQGRLIQGKTEQEWIKSINYNGDEAETKQWRALGPAGIRMLVKGLNTGNGPVESRYARFWPGLPARLRGWLPKPPETIPTRMCAASMLNRLGPDAKSAVPALIQALKTEKYRGVQGIIIACFEEDLLSGKEKEKRELLPELIGFMQSSDGSLRNNAAVALAWYPERADIVAPVLLNALYDSRVEVRLVAAKSLQRVAPPAAATPEVVEIVITILRDPNDQVANQAAELLGEIGKEPSLAVPALIEGLQGTNTLVACMSASALGKFKGQADIIVPALTKMLQHPTGSVRSAAARALKRIDPEAATKAGVK